MTTTLRDPFTSVLLPRVAYYADSSKWWRSNPDGGPLSRDEEVYLSEVLADTAAADRDRILATHIAMIDDAADRFRAALLNGERREGRPLSLAFESLASDTASATDEIDEYLSRLEVQE